MAVGKRSQRVVELAAMTRRSFVRNSAVLALHERGALAQRQWPNIVLITSGVADLKRYHRTDIATAEMVEGQKKDVRVYLCAGAGKKWNRQVIATSASHRCGSSMWTKTAS